MTTNSSGAPSADPLVPAEVFKELDRRSLARHAADHLKGLIVSGELSPGDRLPPERELALHLGVSRPTLREAIGALVIMGLLESRQGAGTFVVGSSEEAAVTGSPSSATISISIAEDPLGSLFELRLLLEPTATERAASRLSEDDLSQMRALLDEMIKVQDDPDQFIRLDVEFHRLIHVAAGSTVISSMLERISALGFRSRTLSGQQPGVPQRTVVEHQAILKALEAKDAFAAKAAMIAHLMHIQGVLIGQAT